MATQRCSSSSSSISRSTVTAAARLAWCSPRPRHPPLVTLRRASPAHRALLSTTPPRRAQNQVFAPIRSHDSFQTYLSLSSAARTPLLTLWTASWCPSCRAVSPLLRSLVEAGTGEPEGGVALADVEFDAPDLMTASAAADNLALTYMITSVPTLLSFDAGEAQSATRVTDARKLADRRFLEDWIRAEARRHGGRGGGGGGGSGGSSAFGGLFSGWK